MFANVTDIAKRMSWIVIRDHLNTAKVMRWNNPMMSELNEEGSLGACSLPSGVLKGACVCRECKGEGGCMEASHLAASLLAASLPACQLAGVPVFGWKCLLPSGVPLQKGLGIASEFSGCQAWPKKQSKERPLGCRWPAGPRAGMCWHRTARRRWARSTPSGVLQERVVDSGRSPKAISIPHVGGTYL